MGACRRRGPAALPPVTGRGPLAPLSCGRAGRGRRRRYWRGGGGGSRPAARLPLPSWRRAGASRAVAAHPPRRAAGSGMARRGRRPVVVGEPVWVGHQMSSPTAGSIPFLVHMPMNARSSSPTVMPHVLCVWTCDLVWAEQVVERPRSRCCRTACPRRTARRACSAARWLLPSWRGACPRRTAGVCSRDHAAQRGCGRPGRRAPAPDEPVQVQQTQAVPDGAEKLGGLVVVDLVAGGANCLRIAPAAAAVGQGPPMARGEGRRRTRRRRSMARRATRGRPRSAPRRRGPTRTLPSCAQRSSGPMRPPLAGRSNAPSAANSALRIVWAMSDRAFFARLPRVPVDRGRHMGEPAVRREERRL